MRPVLVDVVAPHLVDAEEHDESRRRFVGAQRRLGQCGTGHGSEDEGEDTKSHEKCLANADWWRG